MSAQIIPFPVRTPDACARTKAVTRAHLIHEAIDEAIANHTDCDYATIMEIVYEWERIVSKNNR